MHTCARVSSSRCRRVTHVRGCSRSTDVLLPSLQREPVGRTSFGVLGQPDEAARHASLEDVRAREKGSVRPAEAKGHPEASRVAKGHVGTPLAGRLEHGEREEVGGARDEPSERVRAVGHRLPVVDVALEVGVLQQHADQVLLPLDLAALRDKLGDVPDNDLDAERGCTGADDGQRLGEHVAVDKEGLARTAEMVERHDHRLRRSGPFVEERRVGNIEPGEGRGERLEVDERLEATWKSISPVASWPLDVPCAISAW